MKTRRLKATLLAAIMAATGTITFPAVNAKADTNTVSVLLGDVNGDGLITLTDANLIDSYLSCLTQPANETRFTAMDYNYDMIIDEYDSYSIRNDQNHGTIHYNTVSVVPYSFLNNEVRTYRKHTCSLTDTWSDTSYQLPSQVLSPAPAESENEQTRVDYVDNENVPCVYLSIKKANNTMDYVSGVVVGDHIIATAAHNLYDGGYAKKVSVEILNQYCSETLLSFDASKIHIPELYLTSSTPENYDYGLIYTSQNLSSYRANIGVMTDDFTNSGNDLVSSGFALLYGVRRRFKSYGAVQSMSGVPSQKPYRFHSNGILQSGKRGGMVYYETASNVNTCVGIGTIATEDSGGNPVDTYGIRITPTLLRFFYQNNNLS